MYHSVLLQLVGSHQHKSMTASSRALNRCQELAPTSFRFFVGIAQQPIFVPFFIVHAVLGYEDPERTAGEYLKYIIAAVSP